MISLLLLTLTHLSSAFPRTHVITKIYRYTVITAHPGIYLQQSGLVSHARETRSSHAADFYTRVRVQVYVTCGPLYVRQAIKPDGKCGSIVIYFI